uniref:Inositol polyphosphate-related phosphatase domain-containing protein n=1 Tax=Aureoumbra lagunensis TaxID=44058 RepID=A0A7S3JRV5_9STRA|mmetsp:Transcript_4613/g.6947  ORF Transcript_4613/g.6947 Transcript_4613/m.6947 type:complete len:654 (+) Transcript_4613:90-2051(+)
MILSSSEWSARSWEEAAQQVVDHNRELYEETVYMPIWIGTYNVNGKRESGLMLSHWLKCGWTAEEEAPSIWVIALQEMIDLSATNVLKDAVADTLSRSACEEWTNEIQRAFVYLQSLRQDCFKKNGLPRLIAKEYMCGLAIMVFTSLPTGVETLKEIATARIPTGAVGGRLGNKGACATRMKLIDSSVCFVGAHLSAHRTDVESRNADYATIAAKKCFRRDRFGTVLSSDRVGGASECNGSPGGGTLARPQSANSALAFPPLQSVNDPYADLGIESFGILDHDIVFFFGDLNYRIVKSTPDKEVHYLIQADLNRLLLLDQLRLEMYAHRVLSGFIEPQIQFPPTYKYVAGTVLYEHQSIPEGERNASGKKIRCPAWCDRIMYRVCPRGARPIANGHSDLGESVECVLYDRADDRLRVSDHRPVHAFFKTRLRRINSERQALACARIADAVMNNRPCSRVIKASSGTFLTAPAAFPPKKSTSDFSTTPGHLIFGADNTSKPSHKEDIALDTSPLDPPYVVLRAGTPCQVHLTSSRSFVFSNLPSWLHLDPVKGDKGHVIICAEARLDTATKAMIHEHGGKLGASAQLVIDDRTYLVPILLTASPDWGNEGGRILPPRIAPVPVSRPEPPSPPSKTASSARGTSALGNYTATMSF